MKQSLFLAALLVAAPAFAQTAVERNPPPVVPPPQQTPSEIALQINRLVGDWAERMTTMPRQIGELQQQLQAVGRELTECKAKLPPAEPPSAAR